MKQRKIVAVPLCLAILAGMAVAGVLRAAAAPPEGTGSAVASGGGQAFAAGTGKSSAAAVAPGATVAPLAGAPGDAQGEISFNGRGQAQVLCTVTTQCANGGPKLSCTGATCSGNSTSVTCNGTTQQCVSSCTQHCPNDPSYPGTCTSSSGHCSSGFDESKKSWFIECDGHEMLCPSCPNNEIIC